MGRAIADNNTPEVVDAVERAARDLATEHNTSAVVLVGHSGGAAIVANVLGRYPDLAQGAVLVGCGCDPVAWRAARLAETGNPMFAGPTRSLLPLAHLVLKVLGAGPNHGYGIATRLHQPLR
jgi:pimeloyl-ACP methyl ester carboxylesterase